MKIGASLAVNLTGCALLTAWILATAAGSRRFADLLRAYPGSAADQAFLPAGYLIMAAASGLRPERIISERLPDDVRGEEREFAAHRIMAWGVSAFTSLLGLSFVVAASAGSPVILAAGFCFSAVAAVGPFYSEKRRAALKRRDVALAMPAAVSKIYMLISAGLTLTDAWRTASESVPGILGEEMRRTSEMIANGDSCEEAFSSFADRCCENSARRFSWLVIQNLKKGDGELCPSLGYLSTEIWDERLGRAEKAGRNASGALLVPLLMMFGSIILMVAGPLLASFG